MTRALLSAAFVACLLVLSLSAAQALEMPATPLVVAPR